MRLLRTLPLFLLFAAAPALGAQNAAKQALNDELFAAARAGTCPPSGRARQGADVNAKFRYGTTVLFKPR